ncbi:MAG TPA: HPF/RaiA family ribosome-associated protein [Stellaceae bacterium]|nr:HPF/RaiA family ribosome-associated protein [Stellaceae bacterium]
MTIPLQVTFRKMPPSSAVRERIRERAGKLEQFYQRVAGCRVVVEAPHRHHHKGKLYAIAVEVKVPGATLASHRNPGQRHEHEDIYVALRDSFDSIERQIEDFARRKRGE